jgi:hypothetical protein
VTTECLSQPAITQTYSNQGEWELLFSISRSEQQPYIVLNTCSISIHLCTLCDIEINNLYSSSVSCVCFVCVCLCTLREIRMTPFISVVWDCQCSMCGHTNQYKLALYYSFQCRIIFVLTECINLCTQSDGLYQPLFKN